jgi:hypothetical protein
LGALAALPKNCSEIFLYSVQRFSPYGWLGIKYVSNVAMQNTFVIAWKDRTGERCGRGRKILSKEEAEQLAAELNREYPNFTHEAVSADSGEAEEASMLQPAVQSH